MIGAIRYNFRHLFDFTGRDARQTFWYWVLFVVILNVVVSLAISIPLTVSAVSAGIEGAGSGETAAAQAAMLDNMAGMARSLIWVSIVVGIANLALLAASFVRRLHDSGKSGVWAVIAGAVQLASLVLALGQVGDAEMMIRNAATAESAQEAMGMRGEMAWRGLIGWIPLIIVVVFGVMKSEEGPNLYGDAPVRF